MEVNHKTHPRVLVIEDDPGHQRLIELYLKRTGCICEFAGDGKKGIEKAMTGHYDLIFADLNIPELDGFMVATLLREREVQTPLIAVTALELEGIKRKATAVGYDDFLRKPLGQKQIESVLDKYLTKRS